ncbi:MAG: hypothetical protein KKD18_02625 [Nanoarchaeota archaeon]|nr:hypothetical protein [Nanoarchaeota archaeon]
MKSQRKEFEGNILVTISEKEVRLWVCNLNGENIFRFKALGKGFKSGNDVMIKSTTPAPNESGVVIKSQQSPNLTHLGIGQLAGCSRKRD